MLGLTLAKQVLVKLCKIELNSNEKQLRIFCHSGEKSTMSAIRFSECLQQRSFLHKATCIKTNLYGTKSLALRVSRPAYQFEYYFFLKKNIPKFFSPVLNRPELLICEFVA